MPKNYQLGQTFKLYVDTAGVGNGTWALVGDVELVEEDPQKNTGVVKNRDFGYEVEIGGQKTFRGVLRLTYNPGDTNLEALRDAYLDDSPIGIAIMNGAIATIGSEGWQLDALVKTFPRTQEIDNASSVTFEIVPHALGTEPDFVEITS